MQVSMRELKSRLSHYVGEAQAGQTIELTCHRKVVARITGIPHVNHTGAARLVAYGLANWQGGKPQGASLILEARNKSVSDMVLEDRE